MKNKIKWFLVLIILLIPITTFGFKTNYLTKPHKVYRVYLKGESLGLIKSKEDLNKYIDERQQAVKEKYKVKKVYAPSELKIVEETTYSNNTLSTEQIYEKIANISPFTINGYIIRINGVMKNSTTGKKEKIKTPAQTIYVLKKKVFTESAENTARSFVTEETFKIYKEDKKQEIKDVGKIIENIYIKNKITIRKAKISVDEKIYTDPEELTKYLVFGTTEESKSYKVKKGDTLEDVAFKNKMSTEEIMVANPDITDKNTLLYPGQKLKVGIIKPQLEIVEEDHVVKREQQHYTTETRYNKNKYTDYNETKQKGVNGENIVTQKIQMVNGELSNAVTINKEVVKEPIKEIIIKGTKKRPSGGGGWGTYSGPGYGDVVKTKGTWGWPATCSTISSGFGYRWGTLHDGTDIYGCGYGSNIFAAQSGVVVESSVRYDNGIYVIINHQNGYYTIYAHLSRKIVKKGQTVSKGQVIGAMGQTGFATGVHLHFGMFKGYPYRGGRAFNAMSVY